MFPAIFAITVGIGMIGQWVFTLTRKQVAGPEAGATLGRGQIEMRFHWAAEFITALALISAGLGLLLVYPWAQKIYLVSIGMLIYTIINSSGYFAQKGEWWMVGVFGFLLFLALICLGLVL